MQIQALELQDLKKLAELRPEGWKDLEPIHRFYLSNSCCHSRKAVLYDGLVGIGTAICHGKTGWLAHVIVHPEYRNRGIGGALVEELSHVLLDECRCGTVSLTASDLGYPVYLKKKFRFISEYISLVSDAPLPEHETHRKRQNNHTR